MASSGLRGPLSWDVLRPAGRVIGTVALAASLHAAQLAAPRLSLRGTLGTGRVTPAPTIKANVNLVLVPVLVTDSRDRVVDGLTQECFEVFENKHKETISTLSRENTPVSVGLVYDTSGSMADKIRTSQRVTKQFLETLDPADEAMLVTFANRPVLGSDFTRDMSKIQSGLLTEMPSGSTALVDAVYFSLVRMRGAHWMRKALVVVSDGLENHSRYSQRELTQLALEADTQIFTIGVHGRLPASDEASYLDVQSAISLLDDLSTRTGGIHFMIKDLTELEEVLAKIAAALHNHYVLGYYPAKPMDGKWRKIRVKVHRPKGLPPLSVRARDGYYGTGATSGYQRRGPLEKLRRLTGVVNRWATGKD